MDFPDRLAQGVMVTPKEAKDEDRSNRHQFTNRGNDRKGGPDPVFRVGAVDFLYNQKNIDFPGILVYNLFGK